MPSTINLPMKHVLIAVFTFVVSFAMAQYRRTIELKPISNQGLQYYYDLRKVRTPYALQLPLLSIDDEETHARYRRFERLDLAGNLLIFVPIFYLSSEYNSNSVTAAETFFWMVIGTIGLDLTLDLLAHRQLRKGIDRYNQLIVTPSSASSGLSLRYVF